MRGVRKTTTLHVDPRASRFLIHFLAVVARLQREITRVLRNAKLYKSIILSELYFLERKFLSSISELRYSTHESTRETFAPTLDKQNKME